MAEKKQRQVKGSVNGREKPKFRFLNYELGKADREHLATLSQEDEDWGAIIDDLVGQGYKYGLSWDDRNSSFVASLTNRVPGDNYENVCLTGRGSTPFNARLSLLYRHLVIAQGDWTLLDRATIPSMDDYG